jgi:signal transduction histidine kinase
MNSIELGSKKYSKNTIIIHFSIIILLCLGIAIVYWLRFILGYRPELLWRVELFEFIHKFHGMFFLIPIIYAIIVFWWRGALFTLLFAMANILPILISFGSSLERIIVNLLWFSIPLFLVGYINMELSWRNKERQTFMQIEKERQSYMAQLFKAHEEERKLISQELHDDTIQCLLAVARTHQNIAKMVNDVEVAEKVLSVREDILRVSNDLRKLIVNLRPGILDNLGLIPAVRWLIERLNQEGHINAQLSVIGNEKKLPIGPDVTIFRIIQEALNNIREHSNATEAMINLEFQAEKTKLSISDNGKGFELPAEGDLISSKKLGILGIQERVRSLGGTVDIKSKPNLGTTILIEF